LKSGKRKDFGRRILKETKGTEKRREDET